eukprot:304993-Pelagomonas_calceolata.AAC.1
MSFGKGKAFGVQELSFAANEARIRFVKIAVKYGAAVLSSGSAKKGFGETLASLLVGAPFLNARGLLSGPDFPFLFKKGSGFNFQARGLDACRQTWTAHRAKGLQGFTRGLQWWPTARDSG